MLLFAIAQDFIAYNEHSRHVKNGSQLVSSHANVMINHMMFGKYPV
jgi:hypothetical protein